MTHRSRVTLWLLALALVTVGHTTAASAQLHEGPAPGLPVYLALGDSIAAGQQSADPVLDGNGQVDYAATVARWKREGYVAQFAEELRQDLDCLPASSANAADGCRQLQLLNLSRTAVPAMDGQAAQPGVTTQRLIDEQLPVAVELLEARNGDANPRNDVEVVTLTVGGNDIFGPLTTACLPSPGPGCTAAIQSAFAAFAVRYTSVLAELRATAGPDTVLMTMTYYNPLPYCALGQQNPLAGIFAEWVLEGGTLPGLGTNPVGFNDLITTISQQYGAVAVDTFGDLGTGDFVGGADCLHPNLSGHNKIAAEFDEAFSAR